VTSKLTLQILLGGNVYRTSNYKALKILRNGTS
jgi:hypothetical protein